MRNRVHTKVHEKFCNCCSCLFAKLPMLSLSPVGFQRAWAWSTFDSGWELKLSLSFCWCRKRFHGFWFIFYSRAAKTGKMLPTRRNIHNACYASKLSFDLQDSSSLLDSQALSKSSKSQFIYFTKISESSNSRFPWPLHVIYSPSSTIVRSHQVWIC